MTFYLVSRGSMPAIGSLLLEKVKIKSSRTIYIMGSILALILLIGLLRSCFSEGLDIRIFHIGRDIQWYPANLMRKEKSVTAFTDDLIVSIAQKENFRVQLLFANPTELLNRLNNGEFQGILSPLPPTVMNQGRYVFSEPYFFLGPVLIVPIKTKVDGWEQVNNKILGIETGSPAVFDLQRNSSIQLKPYENILKALSDLEDGKIDGVVFPALPAYIYTKTFYDGRLKVATPPLTQEGLRLIALKNLRGEKLIKLFNEGLVKLKEDGTYDKLIEEWGLVNPEKVIPVD